jgi:hypothetical protein
VKERVTLQKILMPEFVITGVISFEIHELALGGHGKNPKNHLNYF